MEIENWFKLKKYPHIGLPITIKDYNWAKEYIMDKEKIKKHSFLPLIHKCISQRKFRPDKTRTDLTKKQKKDLELKTKKIETFYFASHIDSLIFSYYNTLLVDAYEAYISKKEYNNSIVAYRKIPLFKGAENNKCNIEFAKEPLNLLKKIMKKTFCNCC